MAMGRPKESYVIFLEIKGEGMHGGGGGRIPPNPKGFDAL